MDRPLDRITIHELKARTYIGFVDWEREKKQEVCVSICLHADLSLACKTDSVEDTVDYKAVKAQVLDLIENNRFLLIEKMAEDIARLCLEVPRVEQADVVVNKGSALRFAKSVEASITRFKRHE
jgi:D-erythro-7,8-dihydroneopterin triphosphate epimerase